jgi:hypothetical protein
MHQQAVVDSTTACFFSAGEQPFETPIPSESVVLHTNRKYWIDFINNALAI